MPLVSVLLQSGICPSLVAESHTVLAHSRSGLTSDLKAKSLVFVEQIFRFLLRNARVWFALVTMPSMAVDTDGNTQTLIKRTVAAAA